MNRLIIFYKNPQRGMVKTRLAGSIGEDNALKVYQFLAEQIEKTVKKADIPAIVYYSKFIEKGGIWDNHFDKKVQKGKDLGKRMSNAFENEFKSGFQKVCVVGTDVNNLKPRHLKKAYQILDDHDIVLGPAKDGGYYLLGMKKRHEPLFRNKKWSTSGVLENTMEDIKKAGLSYALLEELRDIDEEDDLKASGLRKRVFPAR